MFTKIEGFIVGFDTPIGAALTASELERLEPILRPNESVKAHIRGRHVTDGWTIWVVTNARLICMNMYDTLDLRIYSFAAIAHAAIEPGRKGVQLTVISGSDREIIVGADSALANSMVLALEQQSATLALLSSR